MPLSNLLIELFEDIDKPVIYWQAGIILVCMAVGWGLARMLRNAYAAPQEGAGSVVQVGVAHFSYVLTPVLIASLIGIAKMAALPYLGNVKLLRVALPLVGSIAVIRIVFYLLRRAFARRGPLGAALVTFEKVISLLVWLALALYLTGLWVEVLHYLDNTELPLGNKKHVSLSAILQGAVSVVVTLMLALWAGTALEERLMGVSGMHPSLRVVTARLSKSVLIVIAVLASLSLVGIDLTVLSVFGGALGVGLGLGLQKIASNYVSGFVILLERSLSIGDMILVDKFSGKVTQINTRYTVLQGLDGTETVIPNEMLISGAVQNLSLSSRQVRVATQLTVAYDTDLANLMPKIVAVCIAVDRVLADPEPSVVLKNFAADGFELDVGMWIDDPENGRGSLLSEVNLGIWSLLQREGVSLPYPTRDLRIADPKLTTLLETIAAKQ
jgi:small-conductance mechanosensitive channel